MDAAGTALKPVLGIVGAGLIGASIVEAALAAGAVSAVRVLDTDRSRADAVAARDDRATVTPTIDGIAGCDIVFVCTPVSAIAPIVLRLAGSAVVVDVGSVKGPVLDAVTAGGGAPRFVPGHPLSGGTASGPAGATAAIVSERPFALCPYDGIDADALAAARAFIAAIGGTPVMVDAAVHDRVLALTSHVPHLLAFALTAAFEALPKDERAAAARLMPNSFCETTRFALSDPVMWTDILIENRSAVERALGEVADVAGRIAGEERRQLPGRLDGLRGVRRSLGEGDA